MIVTSGLHAETVLRQHRVHVALDPVLRHAVVPRATRSDPGHQLLAVHPDLLGPLENVTQPFVLAGLQRGDQNLTARPWRIGFFELLAEARAQLRVRHHLRKVRDDRRGLGFKSGALGRVQFLGLEPQRFDRAL